MGNVTIVNESNGKISVRITNDNEKGNTSFFDLETGKSDSWGRENWQVMTVFKYDDDSTSVKVVKPGNTYLVR